MAQSLVQGISSLAWDGLASLAKSKPGEELVFSPLSIIIAIGMLAGAGDAEIQFRLCSNLRIEDSNELSNAFKQMQLDLTPDPEDSIVEMANGIFANDNFVIKDEYIQFLESFAAQITRFADIAKESKKINDWISERTRGRINNMLRPETLRNVDVVLINAIAFTGIWQQEFEKKNTQKEFKFWVTKDEPKEVDMMFLYGKKILLQDFDTHTVVRLPYKQGKGPATFFQAYLPNEDQNLGDILAEIRQDELDFKLLTVSTFGLPKFKSETFLDITSLLESLGYPLSGSWPGLSSGANDFRFNSVLHKAMIDVDEVGTKAAAATVILSRKGRPLAKKMVIFDRPFAYCIVDESGTILFTGIYT